MGVVDPDVSVTIRILNLAGGVQDRPTHERFHIGEHCVTKKEKESLKTIIQVFVFFSDLEVFQVLTWYDGIISLLRIVSSLALNVHVGRFKTECIMSNDSPCYEL